MRNVSEIIRREGGFAPVCGSVFILREVLCRCMFTYTINTASGLRFMDALGHEVVSLHTPATVYIRVCVCVCLCTSMYFYVCEHVLGE